MAAMWMMASYARKRQNEAAAEAAENEARSAEERKAA